jgi:hypothetical protein
MSITSVFFGKCLPRTFRWRYYTTPSYKKATVLSPFIRSFLRCEKSIAANQLRVFFRAEKKDCGKSLRVFFRAEKKDCSNRRNPFLFLLRASR